MNGNGSISVIKINDLLIVNVPQDPDDETINRLQEKVLYTMEQHQSKGVVLDISTVDIMDSYFARTITETAQMVDLMGGKTVIVGMSVSVAITTTQLGLTLGNAQTALNVEKALDMLGSSGFNNRKHEDE